MRGLPYFVSFTTSTAKTDVLDRHYPDLTLAGAPNCAADAAAWATNTTALGRVRGRAGLLGAVSSRHPARLPDGLLPHHDRERTDRQSSWRPSSSGWPTVRAQGALVAPSSGYAWNALDQDFPASSQISAQVTAIYGLPAQLPPDDNADRHRRSPRRTAAGHRRDQCCRRRCGGNPASGVAQRLEIGSVAGEGSVTVVTTASVEAIGATMQTSTGRVDGAAQLATSPGADRREHRATEPPAPCRSALTRRRASMPRARCPTLGLALRRPPSAARRAARSRSTRIALASPRSATRSSEWTRTRRPTCPAISAVALCPSAAGQYGAAGAGWMNTGVGSPKYLGACAQSEAKTVKLFPDATTAPGGLVQIVANDVMARCHISGPTPSAATIWFGNCALAHRLTVHVSPRPDVGCLWDRMTGALT